MSRLRWLLTACALGGAAGALPSDNPALPAAFLVLTLAVVPLWIPRTRRQDAGDGSWSARSELDRAGDPTPGRHRHPPVHRVASALGRVEARELLLNPWFSIGVGMCLLMVVGFAPTYDGTLNETRGKVIQDLMFLAHPLVGMAVFASHRAATRAHRDRTLELFECCPTAARTRAIGVVFAAWVPAAALAAFFIAFLVSADLFSEIHAPFGAAATPNLMAGLALGAGGAALGLAIGRWVRFPLAPMVAVVLIGFVSLRLGEGDHGEVVTRNILSTFSPLGEPTPSFTAGQAWAHAAWLLALTAATVAVALAPGPRGFRRAEVTR